VYLYDDWLRDVTTIFGLNANLQNVTSADLHVKVMVEAFICLEKPGSEIFLLYRQDSL